MHIRTHIKTFFHSKFFKILISLIVVCIFCALIAAFTFITTCGSVQKDFQPIPSTATNSSEMTALQKTIPQYNRPEETTYLTFSEWYLVFNPQEYAEFITTKHPSAFPYFTSIGQFWYGYCQTYGITKNHYEFNGADHLVEVVIGSSFTVEYLIKGVYENTIGRISELTAFGQQTDEDIYAAQVAKEYGEFIPTYPWYDFPFKDKFIGLWTTTSFWGPHQIRKFERKLFLSVEYGVKTIYGWLIAQGTHLTLEEAPTIIYAHVGNVSSSTFEIPHVTKVQQFIDTSYVITVPHYQGFTDTVPLLATQNLQFIDIAGNNEIMITVLAPIDWNNNLPEVHTLFTMNIVTNSTLKRIALQVPVRALSETINGLKAQHIQIEHMFDY